MTKFHQFLISKRVYCENRWCMKHATHVVQDDHGKEIVVCDDHSRLPKAVGSVGEAEWAYTPKSRNPV